MTEVYYDSNHKLVVLKSNENGDFHETKWLDSYLLHANAKLWFKKKKRLIAYSMLNHGACDHDAHFKYHVLPKKKKEKEEEEEEKTFSLSLPRFAQFTAQTHKLRKSVWLKRILN